MIEIRCHTEHDGLVVEVVGDLTAASASVLDSCLDAAIEAEMRDLVLDVGAVRRIDRSVALTLLELHGRLASVGGSLTVRNLDACVSAVTDMVGLDEARGRPSAAGPERGEAVLGGLAARDGGFISSPSSRRDQHAVPR